MFAFLGALGSTVQESQSRRRLQSLALMVKMRRPSLVEAEYNG